MLDLAGLAILADRRLGIAAASAGNQDALLPVGRARLGEGGVEAFVRQHVGLAEDRTGLRRGGFARFGVEVEDRDFRPGSAQRLDAGKPQTGCAAGDDGGN